MKLILLFWSFFQVGLFSFGGGYAAMPLIQDQIVVKHQWISMQTFTDLITISEMTPGPIAVNSSTFVGAQLGGIPGALAATIGCVLPACILVTLIARLYLKYRDMSILQSVLKSLRPAIIAMIAGAGVRILFSAFWGHSGSVSLAGTEWVLVAIFVLCFLLIKKLKWNPVLVMLLAGVMKTLYALAL